MPTHKAIHQDPAEKGKMHDLGYDKLGAEGSNSLFNDWSTTPVDATALNTWNIFLNKYKAGDKDPFTGQKITSDEISAARNAATLFSMTINQKKLDIAGFMATNFSKEAKFLLDKGGYPDPHAISFNYNLFIQKYMTKDKDGNWQRKANMWTKGKDGTWTPNKPK